MIVTTVGNYPKIGNGPGRATLRQSITKFQEGGLTAAELARVEDESTTEALREQAESGVDLVTDGQLRWEDPVTYLARKMDGVEITGLIRYFDSNTYYRQPVIKGALAWRAPITVRDFEFARANSPKPVKAVLPGPFTLGYLAKDEHYRDSDRLTRACAEALNAEARALQAAGAQWIQFDEPGILWDRGGLAAFRKALPALLDGLWTRVAVYTYFRDTDGGLADLLSIPVDCIGLDLVTGPKTEARLLRAKVTRPVAAGIVDARNTRRETPAGLKVRIAKLKARLGSALTAVNPHCGLEFLPREVAAEKLAALSTAAHDASAGHGRRPS